MLVSEQGEAVALCGSLFFAFCNILKYPKSNDKNYPGLL
jgi:hypothetical protein